MPSIDLSQLIARQRPGWSLDQPFYTSRAIYDFECSGYLAKQWYALGHRSEIPKTGDYIVRELLGESLLIARDGDGNVRGYYNVCRHQFLPTGPESTDVTIFWFVDEAARDEDVDVERMIWLWDVTTAQDKILVDRNAAGVRSHVYEPSPYSILEEPTARFIEHYLKELSGLVIA